MTSAAEELARRLHDAHEDMAPQLGYRQEGDPRKSWDSAPISYRAVMTSVAEGAIARSRGTFSWALDTLKAGGKVSRPVWGKGTYVVLQKGYPDGIPINRNTAEATGEPEGTVMVFRPYLMVKLADGTFVPFVPTLDHLLADDWQEGANESEQHPQDDLESLRADRAKLYALEAVGVDNWEGYDQAMETLRQDS